MYCPVRILGTLIWYQPKNSNTLLILVCIAVVLQRFHSILLYNSLMITRINAHASLMSFYNVTVIIIIQWQPVAVFCYLCLHANYQRSYIKNCDVYLLMLAVIVRFCWSSFSVCGGVYSQGKYLHREGLWCFGSWQLQKNYHYSRFFILYYFYYLIVTFVLHLILSLYVSYCDSLV